MFTPTWLNDVFELPGVTDICMNGGQGGRIFVDRGNGMEPLDDCGIRGHWKDDLDLRNWVLEQLSAVGKSWDARHPFVDATLPRGFRLHAVFPPVSRQGVFVSLRRLPEPRTGKSSRWAQSRLFPRLVEIVRQGQTLLISGATGSGKTTLLNDLLAEIPDTQRILAIEDTPELAPPHRHFLSLTSRPPNAEGCGEVTLRMLLKQAMRMRPDRIILGECRGTEVLELLQALNTGHQGAMATLHANSCREALNRVELLCLLAAGGALSSRVIRELLAQGVQWLAHVKRMPGTGVRTISEIFRLEGREGDTLILRDVGGVT